LEKIHCKETFLAWVAERAYLKRIGGDCHTPIAGYATLKQTDIKLTAYLSTTDGSKAVQEEIKGTVRNKEDAQALGDKAAKRLIKNGGEEILKTI
jgi:hydroxymethylbilane synthase